MGSHWDFKPAMWVVKKNWERGWEAAASGDENGEKCRLRHNDKSQGKIDKTTTKYLYLMWACHTICSHNPINKWVCFSSHIVFMVHSRYLLTSILRYTSWLEWSANQLAQPALIYIYIHIFTWAKCDACNRLSTLNRFSRWREKSNGHVYCVGNKVIYWFFGRLLIKFSRERESERAPTVRYIARLKQDLWSMWSTD